MMKRHALIIALASTGLFACATTSENGTLSELQQVRPDVKDVYLEDSLERAAQSYRRYLEETSESARTPEAMRRLADLQVEQAYGVLGSGEIVEMAAPDAASEIETIATASSAPKHSEATESELEFERRATQREALLTADVDRDTEFFGEQGEPIPAGPREAIETYKKILETYPNYERNDKVLYQMSRAYDEIGQPDEAMEVMDRLVVRYPYSKYVDEVQFRRGEYFFIRKQYLDAEDAYGSIVKMGSTSAYYELALYKQGWSLYKQEFYEEALHNYVALLDYRNSIGYDFDQNFEENDEHRIADTFRVISLSFSNLGDPEVVNEYFAASGHRTYADKIYGNLGEFYFDKLRYDDATSVYKSFIALNPFHSVSPHFGMRIIEIYGEAGFPLLVVESKREFATTYALDAEYWQHFDVQESPDVIAFLKTNLTDLAGHYHALYQDENLVDDQGGNFSEAQRWYRQLLASFPTDPETPQVNYQLADLLLENEDFDEAAREYERTAYDYADHEKASAAGYAAVYAYRKSLEVATGARQREVKMLTAESSLRFADTFVSHEQAPMVLAAAADDLYEMKDFALAIESAHKLIDRYPGTEEALLRSAWAVVAHSSIDITEYQDAEHAYTNVLALTPPDDESRAAIIDGLAASIYKQAEQANLLEDYRAAANHFLRIKDVAPTSNIRAAAEYDAAAALMKLQDWEMSARVLEDFRVDNPDHELNADATKQLAFVYHENGQVERAAREHERISLEATDPELKREALLTAGELYDKVDAVEDAIRVYEIYVADYPLPMDIAMETRSRLAEIFKLRLDYNRYYEELGDIVAADGEAGIERTDRSRYLASKAALVLAERTYERFADLQLTQPFEESLSEKQNRMDVATAAFEALVSYEVADVTSAATYYIARIYLDFSVALLESERPAGLSEAEKVDYEMVLEEEAFPFEERAIEIHEENFELLAAGTYNEWVQQSLDELAALMPGRYAKNETSEGHLGSIDSYAYRMPIVPEVAVAPGAAAESPDGFVSSQEP
ncbi:MAG: tetratricopeptide repeat protein [Gammaproteobacteria bacterium]|jgi:tetratricopeptide (TPR) repeat protein|nr:tetratricopeptide repeat protein [Gammaproteobacteria bacterium]